MFGGKANGRWRLRRTNANSTPAFALYQRTETNQYQAFGLILLEVNENRLLQIVSFIDSTLPARFGLPAAVG
jgi:hypothetical protein